MNVFINGENIVLQEVPLSVSEYCTKHQINTERIVIELNEEILKKELYEKTMLKENDVLEIITFVAGG